MGGFFGVVARDDCVTDLFYGTDYHSHMGTQRGGLAVKNGGGIDRHIHDITTAQFRSKFEDDIRAMAGWMGIGVISDFESQPLIIGSRLGTFAIVTVGVIQNLDALVEEAFGGRYAHFSELSNKGMNPTEVVAMLISREASFTEGIAAAQAAIEGSCSILLLTDDAIYAARDRLGRTPVVLGSKEGATAVAMESCALPNLGYEVERYLGPGEVIRNDQEGSEQTNPPGEEMRICAFLWVYYGYPASSYEGINVEATRYRCGQALALRDGLEVDCVAGIPDSGTAHAIGYANQKDLPYRRPFVKYTPTWPRSFMPQDQDVRDLVARMKLIPIGDLIEGQRLLFCEDSIVRGTQLKDIIERLFAHGAKEVHMRPACPPLIHGCRYLNFSRSRSELDLAGRRAIAEIEGEDAGVRPEYGDPDSPEHAEMVERIRERLGLTSLQYQRLEDLIEAIGLPRERVCTYCWNGEG